MPKKPGKIQSPRFSDASDSQSDRFVVYKRRINFGLYALQKLKLEKLLNSGFFSAKNGVAIFAQRNNILKAHQCFSLMEKIQVF